MMLTKIEREWEERKEKIRDMQTIATKVLNGPCPREDHDRLAHWVLDEANRLNSLLAKEQSAK